MQIKWPELVEQVEQGLKIKIDSRQVEPKDVFVALPGSTVEGANYIQQAFKQGASYVVSSKLEGLSAEQQQRVFLHPQPATALGELAAAHFGTSKNGLCVVGITGTNGKTTISYLLEHLFNKAGYKTGVTGTVNYRWPGNVQESNLTTPDCWHLHQTLYNMSKDKVDIVFMEVSSHALDQNRVAGINFKVGVFSNLTQDHLDYHVDMQKYYASKERLFAQSGTDFIPVINVDDQYGQRLFKKYNHGLGFGLNEQGFRQDNILKGQILLAGSHGLSLKQEYRGKTWEIESALVGAHNASNLLAAQATGLSLGLYIENMQALEDFTYIPGRLERVTNKQGLNIFVDYAHTPDALENVLQSLSKLEFERILVVFGCGGNRDIKKRPLMGEAVKKFAQIAVVTSDNPRHEDPEQIIEQILPGLNGCSRLIKESNRKKAIKLALEEMHSRDCLLIAGKGHETYQQVGDYKFPFSDVQVVKEFLQ